MGVLRIVIGVLIGVALGIGCVLAGDWINMQMFPPPPPPEWRDYALNAPFYKLVALPVAYTIAAFVAAFAAAGIAQRRWAGWIAGGLLVASTFANLVMIVHPMWMTIACIVFAPLAAWFGANAGARLRAKSG